MNLTDFIYAFILAMIVALPGLLTLKGQMKRFGEEASGVSADTAGKYKIMLNDEIERRRKAEVEADEGREACKDLVNENEELTEEVRLLKKQLYGLGIKPVTDQ